MTQNPFAHPADFPPPGDQPPQPTRTSVTAILSLVSSIICCIPGLSLIGVVLGLASLMFISGAKGRLSGKGLAWTGILVGALVTALQVGAYIGLTAFCKGLLTQTSAIVTAIEQQDYTKARTEMGSGASSITDAEFAAFRSAYQSELGAPKVVPGTMFEWFGAFAKAGPQIQQQQQQQRMGGAIPVPVEFDQGFALVAMEPTPGGQPPGPWKAPVGNIVIITTTGKHLSLTGSANPPPTPKPPTSPKPAPPAPAPAPGGPGGGGGGG